MKNFYFYSNLCSIWKNVIEWKFIDEKLNCFFFSKNEGCWVDENREKIELEITLRKRPTIVTRRFSTFSYIESMTFNLFFYLLFIVALIKVEFMWNNFQWVLWFSSS